MKVLQKGFNYSQDGPGNRLVYHLQGCNFRCKWCSNPESMKADYEKCRIYSVDEIVNEAERSKMMFFGGGGVTFTGGEPTLQFEELLQTLKKLKEADIHTAIETNGSHPRLLELSEYVDFFIMDIKQPNDEIHKKYTEHSNKTTLKNLELLTKSRKQLLVRIPLINNVNTDADEFIRLFSSLDMSNVNVEILPYHEYGKCKWVEEYEIKDGFVSEEKLKEFTDKLKAVVNLIKT
ncbi:MAG: radical SAM protein [Clostridia bacterium]|nr:radical SAM protein [Clostridia bacterium]